MPSLGKWFETALLLSVCFFAIVFLRCAYCLDEDNSIWILRSGIAIGYFSEVYVVFSKKIHKRLIHAVIFAIMSAGIAFVALRYRNGINPLMMIVFPACFVVPMVVVYLISILPISEILKKASILSLFVFVSCAFTCVLGNEIKNAISALFGILLYYYTVKDRDESPTKLGVLAIFVGSFAMLTLMFGSINHTLFPIVSYMVSLCVSYIIIQYVNSKKKCFFVLGIWAITQVGMSLWLTEPSATLLMSYSKEHREQLALTKCDCHPNYLMITNNNDTISPSSSSGKTMVFLFWTSGCGYCHERFNDFSGLASQFEDDSSVMFVSAFLPTKDDSAYYCEMLKERYDFIWAKTEAPEMIKEELKFNAVPHLVILKNDGSVGYNGLYSNTFVYDPARIIKRYRKIR